MLKIRNISAPKANESSKTAPKLLKIQLTDGVNSLSAIEMEPTDLSIDTKPGTKVRFLPSFFSHSSRVCCCVENEKSLQNTLVEVSMTFRNAFFPSPYIFSLRLYPCSLYLLFSNGFSCFSISSRQIAVKVKQLKMANSQLLFTPNNFEILGGEVEALVSKWEVTRSLAGMKGAFSDSK